MTGLDDLLNEVPDWIGNATGIRAVFGAFGHALDSLRSNRSDVYNQLFITTATWALEFWENELNLVFDPNLTTDQRRERILGRFRSRKTPTPAAVRAMANSFRNGDVETYMDWEKYRLYIRFVDVRGVPSNISELQDQITKMVDANLEVIFQFRFLTVGELANWNNSVSALQQFNLTVRDLMTWVPVNVHRNARDFVGRLRLKSTIIINRNAGLRFRLVTVQSNSRNAASRLRMRSVNILRDLAVRLSLIAPHQSIYWGGFHDYNAGGITPNAGSFGGGGPITGTDPLSVWESHAGKQESLVHFNNGNWMSNGTYVPFNTTNINRMTQNGRFALVEWFPWDQQQPNNDFALRPAAIAAGNHDAYITQWATDCKNWGGPVIIRMGHEMNASWLNAWPWSVGVNGSATVTFGTNTWTNTEADYVNYFRHVVSIFRSVGCNNAQFFWCVNVRAPSDHPYANYYPGKDSSGKPYASWIGWDGYPFFGNTFNQSWRAGQTTVDTYAEVGALDPNLPILVGECAWHGRRGSTMGVTSITASGTQLTVVVPSSPGGGGWQVNQGLVIVSANPSAFNGSYPITAVSGTGPYTLTVPSTIASGTAFTSGTASMVDRLLRASLITTDLETNIPAMSRIKAVSFFFAAYSDDQWTLDYGGTADQANNYDMLAFKKAIGNAHYLAGNVLGTNLNTKPASPFENQVISDRYQEVIRSTNVLEGFWPLTEAALSTTVADISGRARNATVNGNVGLGTAGSIPSLPSATSTSFPGTAGNNIQVADVDAWSIGTTGSWAIELSFFLPVVPAGQSALASKAGFSGQLAGAVYEWQFFVSATQIGFTINQANGSTYASNTNPLPAIGQWHHVIVNCDLSSANPISMTIDGVDKPAGSTAVGTISNGTAPLMFGQKFDNGSQQPLTAGGRIAMPSIYSALLSAETRAAHYAVWH